MRRWCEEEREEGRVAHGGGTRRKRALGVICAAKDGARANDEAGLRTAKTCGESLTIK